MSNMYDFIIENGVLTKYTWKDSEVIIPQSVKMIGNGAFNDCKSLTSITIPDTVTSIGWFSFENCASLANITIPNSVTCIGDYAFKNCTSLTSITISKSVTNIGSNAFYGCTSLKDVYYMGTLEEWMQIDLYNLFSSPMNLYFNGELVENIVMPETVTSIGKSAFLSCSSLTSILMSDSIKSIEKYAFYKCGSLTSVTIGNSVTNIGDRAFQGCNSLATLTIGDSVTTVGDEAFRDCNSLTRVVIGNSVIEIGYCAFCNCHSLKEIVIPDSVTHIDSFAFENCPSLEQIIIKGSNLKEDSLRALSQLDTLHTLVAPDISFDILKKCKLASFAINGYILNKELFTEDYEIEKYNKYISSQRKKILPEIFKEDSVERLSFYEQIGTITEKNFDEEFFNPAQEANAVKCLAFLMDWKNKNVSQEQMDKLVKKELTKDPFNAADMKKIWAYEKIEDGTLAITGYKGNDTIVSIPERIGKNIVTVIAASAFSTRRFSITNDRISKLQKIEEVIIPDSVVRIDDYVFNGCSSLSKVSIGSGVAKIDVSAFYNCNSLENIDVSTNNSFYKSIDGILYSNDEKTIIKYPEGKNTSTFALPDTVNLIGFRAFECCAKLTNITISNFVITIKGVAFVDCTSLINITIPDSVTTIERAAFKGCKSLTDIDYGGSEEEWQKISIGESNDYLYKATVHFEK